MRVTGQIEFNGSAYKLVPQKMLLMDRLDVQLCALAIKRVMADCYFEGKYSPEEMDLMRRLFAALGKETDPEDLGLGLKLREQKRQETEK